MVTHNTITEPILPVKQLFDESYQNNSKQLKLYLQLGKNQLLATHFDQSKKQFISLENYNLGKHDSWYLMQQQTEALFHSLASKQGENHTSIALVDHLYTLVPLAFFDEEKLATYLNFNHQNQAQEELHYQFDTLESQQTAIVYAMPKSLHKAMENTFTKLSWCHFAFPLLESILMQKNSHPMLHLHLQNQRFDVIYVADKKLNFFNSFSFQTPEDLIYYLLFVMEQLKLDQQTTIIQLIGEFEEKSANYEILYKYIQNIKIGKKPQAVKYSQILSALAPHQYYSLFNQYLCE